MNIYETFKKLGWRPRVKGDVVFEAEFRDSLFIAGFRGRCLKRTRRQILKSAEHDLVSGKASWLKRETGNFYKAWTQVQGMKFSSQEEMALRLTAIGECG